MRHLGGMPREHGAQPVPVGEAGDLARVPTGHCVLQRAHRFPMLLEPGSGGPVRSALVLGPEVTDSDGSPR